MAGAKQGVHAGVADGEGLVARALHVLHAGEQDAGIGHDGAAGLEDDPEPCTHGGLEDRHDGARVLRRGGAAARLVVGREAAAHVEHGDLEALGEEFLTQGECLADGLLVGIGGVDGRADVEVESHQARMLVVAVGAEERAGAVDVHAELGFLGTRGGEAMRLRVHVRVDAERAAASGVALAGDARDVLELRLALDVQEEDAGIERGGDLVIALADARVDDAFRGAARGACAVELAARDHVHAGAAFHQRAAHGEVAAALHRVADEGLHRRERLCDPAVVLHQRGLAVDVAGGADGVRDGVGVGALAVQRAVFVGEMVHGVVPRRLRRQAYGV